MNYQNLPLTVWLNPYILNSGCLYSNTVKLTFSSLEVETVTKTSDPCCKTIDFGLFSIGHRVRLTE